jgi:ribonuclease HII
MTSNLFELDGKLRRFCGDRLAGVDEAGRGPWAGPVVSAVVILPPAVRIQGLNDSKLVSPQKREELYEIIVREAEDWAVGIVGPRVIDRINILQATYESMRRAFSRLRLRPDLTVVDGRLIPELSVRQTAFPGADRRSASVAAASIIAKVTRDRMMTEAHTRHPHYGFDRHKGYGTKEHSEALRLHGPCEIHRKSFEPVRVLAIRS